MALDANRSPQLPLDPAAADDPDLPGPFTVGTWAAGFRDFLRERPRVLLIGEVFNHRRARASTYFELRDPEGAARCSIWNSDLDRLQLADGALRDGAEVVVGGGPDYYPGSKTASPSFSFRATYLRPAGEGDLLAQLDRTRRKLDAEGLLRPQKELRRPAIPKTIGVVTARGSAACADLLAGLERRGWRGTIVWADGFQKFLRQRPRVLLLGEVFNLRRARTSTWFELRDGEGAVPCSIWNSDLDVLGLVERRVEAVARDHVAAQREAGAIGDRDQRGLVELTKVGGEDAEEDGLELLAALGTGGAGPRREHLVDV